MNGKQVTKIIEAIKQEAIIQAKGKELVIGGIFSPTHYHSRSEKGEKNFREVHAESLAVEVEAAFIDALVQMTSDKVIPLTKTLFVNKSRGESYAEHTREVFTELSREIVEMTLANTPHFVADGLVRMTREPGADFTKLEDYYIVALMWPEANYYKVTAQCTSLHDYVQDTLVGNITCDFK